MHQDIAVVLALLFAPMLLITLLRINGTLVFLSLCLGYVLMQFLGGDVQSFATLFVAHAAVSTGIMKLVLLLFPAVFTMVFMIRTLRGSKFVFNILPTIASGCLTVLLVVPLLPPGLSHAIAATSVWHEAVRLQSLVVGVGAVVSLMFLWMLRPKKGSDGHHK